ncbi:MAG TPA: hypothetical protein VFT97_01735, partial [Candidatus Eisenbacteria bacterium]|nr:hypothetical protein [Candidatus Eisenbacteria bacterium]
MKLGALILIGLFLVPAAAGAAPTSASNLPPVDLPIPQQLVAKDRPGDSGGAVVLTWKDPSSLPAGAEIEVLRAEPPAYEWQPLGRVQAGVGTYTDTSAKDGITYRYGVRTRPAAADSTADSLAAAAAALAGAPVVSDPVSPH